MDIGSVHSLHSMHDYPLPTPRDENKAVTVKRLSYVLGFLYAMFLIIFGLLSHTFNAIKTIGLRSPIFNLYVVVSGTIILLVLIVDIKLFTRRIRKQVEKLRHKEEEMELEHLRQVSKNNKYDFEDRPPEQRKQCAYPNGWNCIGKLNEEEKNKMSNQQLDAGNEDDSRVSRNNDEYGTPAEFTPLEHEVEHIEHSYCFAQGRHAGSVYLKFGAAAFALGHFVHIVLLVVVVHVSIFMTNTDCISILHYIVSLLESLYCFIQLLFIFNYSNLIIIKHATLARVAFLHIIAGNICQWISAVVTETQLAYRAYEWAQVDKNKSSINLEDRCLPTSGVFRTLDDYAAYLFPFTVEFNILTVGIFFMVWRHIGKCRHSKEEIRDYHHSLYAHTHDSGDVNGPHILNINISCGNSLGGLFSSLFVVVILIVSIILGFVFGTNSNEYLQGIGLLTGNAMKLLFHVTMFFTTAFAFWKTRTLDINKHHIPWLDDVLLYICVPAFFVETMFTIVATLNDLHIIQFLDTIIMSLQMIIQMAFIIDGLRRCSNSRKLRRTRPGRELVLFLLVTNVSMWFMYTFSYKSPESKDVRYKFYGKTLWLAIGHVCAPLIMFFRFHSSVCIADIWSYAYKPGLDY